MYSNFSKAIVYILGSILLLCFRSPLCYELENDPERFGMRGKTRGGLRKHILCREANKQLACISMQ